MKCLDRSIHTRARHELYTFFCFILFFFSTYISAEAQIVDDYLEGEKFLYAETKQVNQFLRRFNAEESEEGVKLLPDDKQYHNQSLRKQFLPLIFDNFTSDYPDDLKKKFVKDVLDNREPQYLNFRSDGWFAEVTASVSYKGKEENVVLFLKVEEENLGYKWVFEKVYFEPFVEVFDIDTTLSSVFLHPMSHEIDFMNLQRAFQNKEEIEEYTYKYYQPDFLSLFLFEIKQSNLQFKNVKDVKFHFFQIDDWYFEISEFNRSGYNKGWLISNLVKVPEDQKDILRNYIYFGK